MSRSGLGYECELPPGFDKAYESPPQPNLLGSQSTFTHHHFALPPEHLNYPHGIISHCDAPISPTTTLPSTSTNTQKKRRGRPYSSRNQKPRMNIVYGMNMSSLKSHMIIVNTEENVLEKITAFIYSLSKNVTIISSNGTISKVRFSQSPSSAETVTYEGRFEILSLKGSVFVGTNKSEQEIVAAIKGSFVSLSNGRVFGGKIDGVLIAATPVQIILGSFFPEGREVVLSGPNDPPTEGPSNPPSVVHPSTGILIS
ncbi:AT-hook motif nuclear-localized protein 10-like [Vicia villosa]|uniref:AT-hook motif nuclear-localized protein 10-like n=1 Tax=Vicia villosa TaxID=3911 RepID=UPI00273CBBCA|nr:AT-hook motif nuclear-localized protein 10-like [Vicia villosa]